MTKPIGTGTVYLVGGGIVPPAMIIVGEVVLLRERLAWPEKH